VSSSAIARAPEASQFDFWAGGWDVNLRIQQSDASWQDSVQAHAQVYPILQGKAMLELWDSPSIKGYSLRYYDSSLGKWVLWLNWPSQDSSGSSSLQGEFRHNRGEFYARNTRPDGNTSISRFSFSDIGPDSLRWDDAYSQDSGKTWTNQWVMEFSRTAQSVALPQNSVSAHTYIDGSRATLPQFASYEYLAGRWQGHYLNSAGLAADPAQLQVWKVLDGCAVIGLLEYSVHGEPRQAFFHLTWNTHASRYEITYLDDAPDSSALVAYSPENSEELVFPLNASDEVTAEQLALRLQDDGTLEFYLQTPTNQERAWPQNARLRFSRSE